MPSRAKTSHKVFAERILTYEAEAGARAGSGGPAVARVCERFQELLVKLLGAAGFRALFSRALALAQGEVAGLRTVRIDADGTLRGLDAALMGAEEQLGEVVLVARLIELLVTFIGPALTAELIRNAWPRGTFDDLDF